MLSDGKTGGEELNVGQQWIQMVVRLLRRPDLDFGSAEWLAGCVCVCVMVLCVCVVVLCVCVCDGSLCVCVGSACQIFEYTQSRHIKMVYWWNICVCLHESFAVCVCVQETHLKSLSADRVYTIHLSFIWRHICASVCIFLILLWHQQCWAGSLQLAALLLMPRSDYRLSESSDGRPPHTARLSASSSGVSRLWRGDGVAHYQISQRRDVRATRSELSVCWFTVRKGGVRVRISKDYLCTENMKLSAHVEHDSYKHL